MRKTILKTKFVISFMLMVALLPPIFSVSAQDNSALQQAENEKIQLQQQLDEIEKQIIQYEEQLKTITGQKNTLQNKIKQLQNQQAALNLQIKATNLQIARLDTQLKQTQFSIDENIARIEQYQEQMAQIIRTIDEYDNYPLMYTIIDKDNLSDAFDEIERRSQVFTGLKDVLSKVQETKKQLDQQAEILSDQQDEAKNLLSVKILQQQKLSGSVGEQRNLLQQTKGVEKNYQTVLTDSKKKAAEVRTRLYQLLGVSTQITFGEAVKIAQWASEQTGVRIAFLLAILTQESNLGKNVGTCNRPGDPPEKSWKVVMKPSRDQQPFLAITAELGMDPNTTPVSCPMRDSKGNRIGWGGAMGPAQFIPSTWMGYKNKVTEITGMLANPWDIRDAFIAAAIKLKAGGAGSVSGEWAAAMRYFSGSTNTKYRFYGDSVVALAAQYQNDIDTLNAQ
ncbi:MAG: hypothetical protein Q8N59_01370 [bacterium]|nr:hypothetical protein [bacterium]